MNKEFIPYEQALELNQLGFDEKSLDAYYKTIDGGVSLVSFPNEDVEFSYPFERIPAPLYQQAFRWFREKYQLYAWVKVEYEYGGVTPTYYITGKRQSDIAGGAFNTYEEAELACLKKLIELVKQSK